jgi:hypothetical protein
MPVNGRMGIDHCSRDSEFSGERQLCGDYAKLTL